MMTRQWFGAVGFTVALQVLIAFSVTLVVDYFFVVMLAMIFGSITFFFWMFPGSRFFAIALANFLAVYTCVFVFFVDANFRPVDAWVLYLGYTFPILAFLGGSALQRDRIREIVNAERLRDERHIIRIFQWLVPVFAIGAVTFVLPELGLGRTVYDVIFLAAMAAIGGIVSAVSPTISMFLIDTGLMFEDFFRRIRRLVVPAFAFLTFYSLNIVAFASLYRIIDRFSSTRAFMIEGQLKEISFAESLYFSVVTLSTVGYGDMTPHSNPVRVVVAVQIVFGVLLLLFGFYEIISYSRGQRPGGED